MKILNKFHLTQGIGDCMPVNQYQFFFQAVQGTKLCQVCHLNYASIQISPWLASGMKTRPRNKFGKGNNNYG